MPSAVVLANAIVWHRKLSHLVISFVAAMSAACLAGCTATAHRPPKVASNASPSRLSTAFLADPRFAHGVPSPSTLVSPVPPAPHTVGAAAEESISDVADLHNLAVIDSGAPTLPLQVLTAQARDLDQRFTVAIGALGQPAPDAPAARLAIALNGYDQIAIQLQGAKPPHISSSQLQHLDALWKEALALVDLRTGSHLSQTIPPLLMPSAQQVSTHRLPARGTASP